MLKFSSLAAAVAAMALALPASASIVFDNGALATGASNRTAGSSPLAMITVASTQTIDQIGVKFNPNANGNLKFVIFDTGTGNLLFSTGAEAFVDTGDQFYLSSVFSSFTLNAGTTYAIGGVADVGGLWDFATPGSPYSQGGFTARNNVNGNVSGFASPSLVGNGAAMIMVQLGSGSTVAVPEPGSLLLSAAALLASAAAMRRRSA